MCLPYVLSILTDNVSNLTVQILRGGRGGANQLPQLGLDRLYIPLHPKQLLYCTLPVRPQRSMSVSVSSLDHPKRTHPLLLHQLQSIRDGSHHPNTPFGAGPDRHGVALLPHCCSCTTEGPAQPHAQLGHGVRCVTMQFIVSCPSTLIAARAGVVAMVRPHFPCCIMPGLFCRSMLRPCMLPPRLARRMVINNTRHKHPRNPIAPRNPSVLGLSPNIRPPRALHGTIFPFHRVIVFGWVLQGYTSNVFLGPPWCQHVPQGPVVPHCCSACSDLPVCVCVKNHDNQPASHIYVVCGRSPLCSPFLHR